MRAELCKRECERLRREHPEGTDHIPFTKTEVRIAREEMSNNKAPEHSRIKKEDFEISRDTIDELVVKLVNKISEQGKWPNSLKKQVVYPLVKDSKQKDQIR